MFCTECEGSQWQAHCSVGDMKPRYLLVTVALLSMAATQSLAVECAVSGEVFTVDPIAGTILVRDDGGYLKLVEVDGRTTFTFRTAQPSSAPNLTAVNSGDLVCVNFIANGSKIAAHIIDLPRADVQARQREWVAKWQKSLIRGRLDQILSNPDRLVLDTGDSPLEVTVPADTPVRLYQPASKALEDGRDGSFSQLLPGMLLSVRLNPDAGTGSLTARSIYTGGVTSIAGTITAIDALGQTVSVREFGTDRRLKVRVSGSRLYRALPPSLRPYGPHSPSTALVTRHKLVQVGFSEIEISDWVLLTGMPGSEPGTMECFALVTRLGYLDSDAAAVPRF